MRKIRVRLIHFSIECQYVFDARSVSERLSLAPVTLWDTSLCLRIEEVAPSDGFTCRIRGHDLECERLFVGERGTRHIEHHALAWSHK